MVRIKERTSPVDYSLCNQTVTVYHWDGKDTYTRKVFTDAFLDFKKTQNVDKTGSSEVNGFLLVIPGPSVPVSVGDKVLLGNRHTRSLGVIYPGKGPRPCGGQMGRPEILARQHRAYGGWRK